MQAVESKPPTSADVRGPNGVGGGQKSARPGIAVSRSLISVSVAGLPTGGKPAKDARAYLFIDPSPRIPGPRIGPDISAPGARPLARSEIIIGPSPTFAREAPETVVRAPRVERGPSRFSG